MKYFTHKINQKMNTIISRCISSGRPAAPRTADHQLHASDNAGFSLPEIIVAILIVGIVIVPLLTNFAVTACVNANSLRTKDVTDYAEQIIETLQSYTPDEVDEQFGCSTDSFKIADVSEASFGRTNERFEVSGSDINDIEKQEKGQLRYYFIRGAKAPDNRTYDIQITYDPRSYASSSKADGSVHAYNLEEIPDSSSFSRSTTAIINPNDAHVTFPTSADGKNIFDEKSQSYEFVNNTSYEENAVNGFYGVYTAYINAVREGFENLIDTKADKPEGFTLKNEDFSDGESESVKKARLRKNTDRYTVIIIEKSNSGKCILSSYMQFQLTGEDDYKTMLLDQTSVRIKAEEKLGKLEDKDKNRLISEQEINDVVKSAAESVAASRNSDIVPCYKVFYNDDGYNKLENIYLMTKPLSNDFHADRIAVKFADNSAEKMYSSDSRLGIYIVPQIGLLNDKNTDSYIKPVITSISSTSLGGGVENRIKDMATGLRGELLEMYYAKGWFAEDENFRLVSSNAHDSLVKNVSADLIYDVKVSVYESSGGSWKNKLIELDTSIQQ